jgi:hypothetical protein
MKNIKKKKTVRKVCEKFVEKEQENIKIYRVIINDCPIVVGVEKPHKFWMCRQSRNVRQTSRQISTTATYWRY